MQYLEDIREYWNKRAKGYSEKNVKELDTNSAEFWEERLIKLLPKGKVLNCIDVGTGPGFLGILLAKMGHNVTLFDYSENMLSEAKNNAKAQNVEVSTKKGDAQNLDFEDETYDVVVSRNLVWNLENPEKAYLEWLRVLKKGGKLIVFDGNHYLHQYNKEYMELKHCPKYVDPHTKEYMKGVNPEVMDNIALNLPLSKVERPYWDMEFFIKNKITNVYTQPIWSDYIGENKHMKSIIKEFIISVEK